MGPGGVYPALGIAAMMTPTVPTIEESRKYLEVLRYAAHEWLREHHNEQESPAVREALLRTQWLTTALYGTESTET